MFAQQMMTIGELMELKIEKGFVKTKLQELDDSGRFTVFHPTVKGLPVKLETGDTYNLRFFRPNGIFSFDALLLNWYTKNDIRLCLFEPQTEVVKAQRRQSYRLPIVLNVLLRPSDAAVSGETIAIKGKTVDLSEHGMLMTCFASLSVDTAVIAELTLSPGESMTIKGKVIRCEKPADRKGPHSIVLLFSGITNEQRAYLGRYILRQQIIARKKKNQEVMI